MERHSVIRRLCICIFLVLLMILFVPAVVAGSSPFVVTGSRFPTRYDYDPFQGADHCCCHDLPSHLWTHGGAARARASKLLTMAFVGQPTTTRVIPTGRQAWDWSLSAGKNKKKKVSNQKDGYKKVVAVNRIAYRNFEILETLEAGISLVGTEVKAIRDGKLNLRDGYIRPSKQAKKSNKWSSLELYNVHIGKHETAGAYFQHEERRIRPLLVHKHEARKWCMQVEQQPGWTMVPLQAYFVTESRKLKLQIALCRGKTLRDKRATIQARDQQRESQRILKSFRASL